MSREATDLAVTYGYINDVQDAYVDTLTLRRLARETGRYWTFHSVPTTVALPGNRYAKSLRPFTDHNTEDDFRALLREYRVHRVPRPSGYADVFHQYFKSPHIDWSTNAMLAPAFAGGWQDAISPGFNTGVYYKYDMRSAYLWAATLGLPDPLTYERSLRPSFEREGVYRLRLKWPSPRAPFPFNRCCNVLASTQEIETYGLEIDEVVSGVTWETLISGDSILATMLRTSTWKQAGRCYWGRWAQMERVRCVANGKMWTLPNLTLNIPWAHMIVSRVKMRLWEFANDAVHVFVDSVITPHTLPTGSNHGDWKLEKTYKHGVLIRAPGQYGDATELKFERMSGIPQASHERYL